MAYIYKLSNNVNNMVYIGQTTREDIQTRYKEHLYASHQKSLKHRKLYEAINKIGFENFNILIIEECENDLLDEREKYWIDYYDSFNNGYNGTKGGQGEPRNLIFSKAIYMLDKKTKEKIKEFNSLGDGARYIIENGFSKTNNIKTVISAISQNLNKQRQSAYGFSWEYQNKEKDFKPKQIFYCIDCHTEISSKAIRCNHCEQIKRHM